MNPQLSAWGLGQACPVSASLSQAVRDLLGPSSPCGLRGGAGREQLAGCVRGVLLSWVKRFKNRIASARTTEPSAGAGRAVKSLGTELSWPLHRSSRVTPRASHWTPPRAPHSPAGSEWLCECLVEWAFTHTSPNRVSFYSLQRFTELLQLPSVKN